MSWQAPRTFVTGELVTAAILNQEIRDNLEAIVGSSTLHGKITGQLLQRVDLASDGSITLDNIVSGFSELRIPYSIRSTRVLEADSLRMAFDGDETSANYHRQNNEARDGAAEVDEGADDEIAIVSAANSPADSKGTGFISIIDYDAASSTKQAISNFVCHRTVGDVHMGSNAVVHEDGSTGPIDTSIKLYSSSDSLVSGSWAELWGY